jgi:hypothetical protein
MLHMRLPKVTLDNRFPVEKYDDDNELRLGTRALLAVFEQEDVAIPGEMNVIVSCNYNSDLGQISLRRVCSEI